MSTAPRTTWPGSARLVSQAPHRWPGSARLVSQAPRRWLTGGGSQAGALAAVLLAALLAVRPPPAAATATADAVYADGALLQAVGDDKLYVVEGGKRRWVTDGASLQQLRVDGSHLQQVTRSDLDALPPGRAIHQFPLARDAATGRVYLITQEADLATPRKHWIRDLDSFTQLGFDWSEIAPDGQIRIDLYPYAPALTYLPQSMEQTAYETAAGQFTSVPAWRLQTEDERLLLGLTLANTYGAAWRAQVAPTFAARGTWIQWADLPEGVGGAFQPRLNLIAVSRALQDEPFGVIAAVIAHEGLHATSPHSGSTQSCYDEEVQAFTLQAATWEAMPAQWRAPTDFGRAFDALVSLWHGGRLPALIAADVDYQAECSAQG